MKLDFGSGHNPKEGYKTCDSNMSPHLDYICINNKIQCNNELFDKIYTRNTLHHINDVDEIFKEFNRILKANGYLIIVDSNQQSFSKNIFLDKLWYRFVIPRPEIQIVEQYRNYIPLLEKYGFRIISFKTLNEKEYLVCQKLRNSY